jgi:hypothetical protein
VVGDPRPFTEALVAAVDGLAVGDPAEEGTVVGPVITEQAMRRVTRAAAEAKAAGGRLLTGGDGDDWFVASTPGGYLQRRGGCVGSHRRTEGRDIQSSSDHSHIRDQTSLHRPEGERAHARAVAAWARYRG